MIRLFKSLYFWVLLGILFGGTLGVFSPSFAQALSPVAEGFILLIKILVGPVVFCSVVMGIVGAESKKSASRIALKALLYFELVSTFALVLGLLVGNLLKPGAGFQVNTSTLDSRLVSKYSHAHGSLLNPLQSGFNLIQVLVLGLVCGGVLLFSSPVLRLRVIQRLRRVNEMFLNYISKVMVLAPLGAGAAMAFTTGKFGLNSLRPLFHLMFCFYLTCGIFIFLILGLITRRLGFRVIDLLRYLRSEILLVLGTSSSESALAPLMQKLERLGCSPKVVGLVVPTGYSFNLDGTNIYLTLSVLFIAQAFSVPLSLEQQLGILMIAMVSSKGASGVTGAGFITLAATLAVVPEVPLVGLTLILGIDRFMSEARAITNMIGNSVATLVLAHSESSLDYEKLHAQINLSQGVPYEA